VPHGRAQSGEIQTAADIETADTAADFYGSNNNAQASAQNDVSSNFSPRDCSQPAGLLQGR